MIGSIIGDIVGSRFEFDPTYHYDFELFTPECSFTDDTVCTVAIADALLRGQDFGATLHAWCRRYPDPMGSYGGRFADWVDSDDPQPYGSFGNGSAMRVSPVAWLASEAALILQATASAACTHDHPEGIRGAVAVAMAIRDCLTLRRAGVPSESIRTEGLRRALDYSGYNTDIDLEDVQGRFDETCQGTVPVALWIIQESSSFEDAIRRAVSLEADADTLGAIVGGIAEAIWGVPEWMQRAAESYLPEEMKEVLTAFRSRIADVVPA